MEYSPDEKGQGELIDCILFPVQILTNSTFFYILKFWLKLIK